jgi:hypothetical protein
MKNTTPAGVVSNACLFATNILPFQGSVDAKSLSYRLWHTKHPSKAPKSSLRDEIFIENIKYEKYDPRRGRI